MALNAAQERAFGTETESAYNLLRYGVEAVRSAAFAVDAYDAILTTLSIGVEKTLKLALGLGDLASYGSWTTYDTVKKDYRHDILGMWALLQQRFESTTGLMPYAPALLIQVKRDPVLPATFAALDMYGKAGRFYHLDELADVLQKGLSPFGAWSTAENAASEYEVERRKRDLGNDATEESLAGVWSGLKPRAVIADSLDAWRLTVAVFGLHGAMGELGRGFGSVLRRDVTSLPEMPVV